MAPKEKKELSVISRGYLFLYNFVQCAGWSYILILCCMHFSQHGFTPKGLYNAAEMPLKVFQTAAILEVVHCIIGKYSGDNSWASVIILNFYILYANKSTSLVIMAGLVPSPVAITAMQVASRLIVLWSVTHSVKEVRDVTGVLLFMLAWTVTEIIRYSLYAFTMINKKPYVLLWLRYSLFIALYPIGVTGEFLTIYNALPYVKEQKINSGPMFNFYYALIVCMFSYIPGFPNVYFYMLKQRKKALGNKQDRPQKTD